MDGILALGHFCETHGPCIILCTQQSDEEPKQVPRNVLVCEACQSLDLKQAVVSRDDRGRYVTTRTPLQQDLAFLLKQAVVRSLSCEETSKDGGVIYFGDNERGHVISHNFSVQDSLARGFQRKYCILMLMRDKIHLLNCWPFLTKHLKRIAGDIQEKAIKVNNVEQQKKSQRAVRQAQTSPGGAGRSLSQLTGEPAIFVHIHLWFTWLLSTETVLEKPAKCLDVPADVTARLRDLYQKLDDEVFRKLCYCYLTGIRVEATKDVEDTFKTILPKGFSLPTSGDSCKLTETKLDFRGSLPQKLSSLQILIEKAVNDQNLPDSALEPHLTSLVMQWHNIACVLGWAPNDPNVALLQSLGVQKWDMPMLSYWIPQCKKA